MYVKDLNFGIFVETDFHIGDSGLFSPVTQLETEDVVHLIVIGQE